MKHRASFKSCSFNRSAKRGKEGKELIMKKEMIGEVPGLRQWQDFYKKHFDLGFDFSRLSIPEQNPGFDRLIIVARGLTLNQAYDACVKHFPCWRYTDDLDKAVPDNDRSPASNSYAIWVRNRVEADEELKNLSADQLKDQGILGITLLERLLLELAYWDETNKHLDIRNRTLCTGSRHSVGRVPYVHWDDDRLRVYWYGSQSVSDCLRARAAVPCQP